MTGITRVSKESIFSDLNNLEVVTTTSNKYGMSFEKLMNGEQLFVPVDEQIVYDQLDNNENAIWSFLVESGYLKVLDYERYEDDDMITEPKYELTLTNYEVRLMFQI